MLQTTVERLLPLTPMDDVFIVGNKEHAPLFSQQVPQCDEHHLVLEPVGKNTAACIATMAFLLHRVDPDSILLILPADHWIAKEEKFRDTLYTAAVTAFEEHAIVTLGVPPTFPSTGYGYIEVPESELTGGRKPAIFRVKRFVEKPDLKRARAYLESGNFYWNSGIFVARSSVMLEEIGRYLPDLYAPLRELARIPLDTLEGFLEAVYPTLPAISIDYGVMEKTKKAMMIEADFGWSDVGSWDALYDLSSPDESGNVVEGHVLLEGCRNCLMQGGDRLIAAVGLEGVLIVDTPDAVLVLPRGRSQEVRRVVERLKEAGLEDLL